MLNNENMKKNQFKKKIAKVKKKIAIKRMRDQI
jgi:hypothetical protein